MSFIDIPSPNELPLRPRDCGYRWKLKRAYWLRVANVYRAVLHFALYIITVMERLSSAIAHIVGRGGAWTRGVGRTVATKRWSKAISGFGSHVRRSHQSGLFSNSTISLGSWWRGRLPGMSCRCGKLLGWIEACSMERGPQKGSGLTEAPRWHVHLRCKLIGLLLVKDQIAIMYV